MLNVDIIIFGGGIAGLWTLDRLTRQGYNALLLENNALGSGQTIKSQGIIHGGLKYALNGNLSNSVTALQDMPTVWQQCLSGCGEVDLSGVKVLADGQYMWSADKLIGGVTTLLASSTMHSTVTEVPPSSWPQAIQNSAIRSKLYQLRELVLDVPSLLKVLGARHLERCLQVTPDDYMLEIDSDQNIKCVAIKFNGVNVQINARKYIFTAGAGNANLIKELTDKSNMQLRPLQMVLVKAKTLLPLYGHCISLGTTPRLTVTTHTAADHTPVWYLGGKLAEEGVKLTSEQIINVTKQELSVLFPNLDFSAAQYASFFVDRAEAKQNDGGKPNSATVIARKNYITAWPTKLALAPILTEQIMQTLSQENIKPQASSLSPPANLPRPAIATPIWDQLL